MKIKYTKIDGVILIYPDNIADERGYFLEVYQKKIYKNFNITEDFVQENLSRSKKNAMVTDPEIAKEHVIKMIKNQALNCYSGKQIPCEIDSICVHGDGKNAVNTAKQIKEELVRSGVTLKPLDEMKKFI